MDLCVQRDKRDDDVAYNYAQYANEDAEAEADDDDPDGDGALYWFTSLKWHSCRADDDAMFHFFVSNR